MNSKTTLDKEILIFAAEQYLVFFEDIYVDARKEFIKLYNNNPIGELELPEDICSVWEPFEHYSTEDIFELIESLKRSIKTFIINQSLHENSDYLSFISMKNNRSKCK